MCVCARARARERACVRAAARARVYVCVCVCCLFVCLCACARLCTCKYETLNFQTVEKDNEERITRLLSEKHELERHLVCSLCLF